MSQPIIHRLITPVQARGNIGKSTVLNLIAGWLEQRSVEWHGFDLDPDHRCFERTFPDTVSPVTLGDEPEGDVIKLLRSCASRPATVIDPRAHLNEVLLRSFDLVRFQEWFSAASGKLTVLLFPADDLEIMTDIDRTVSRLAASVDYIVVRNRARAPRTRMFDGSELESDLVKLGAVTLEVPVLLAMARNQLAVLEAELGRGVSHVEAVANRELPLDPMVRMIVDDWLRGLFRRLDEMAGALLPTDLASANAAPPKSGPPPAAVRRGAKINRTDL